MAKAPTQAQLDALAAGRRKRAAQAASDDAADAGQRREDPDRRPRSKRAATWGWVAGIIIAAALGWLLFATLRPRSLSPGGDLIRWTPGPPWRFRDGQFIAPAAAEALAEVAADLGDNEACRPMTLDISREGGGPYPPHKSHQNGTDIDIRMTDIAAECRARLQASLASRGWLTWYDGPDNVGTPNTPSTAGAGNATHADGSYVGRQKSDARHISHLHARLPG